MNPWLPCSLDTLTHFLRILTVWSIVFHGSSWQLKQHKFFEGIDWLRLSQRHMIPPYIPKVDNRWTFFALKLWGGILFKHSPMKGRLLKRLVVCIGLDYIDWLTSSISIYTAPIRLSLGNGSTGFVSSLWVVKCYQVAHAVLYGWYITSHMATEGTGVQAAYRVLHVMMTRCQAS